MVEITTAIEKGPPRIPTRDAPRRRMGRSSRRALARHDAQHHRVPSIKERSDADTKHSRLRISPRVRTPPAARSQIRVPGTQTRHRRKGGKRREDRRPLDECETAAANENKPIVHRAERHEPVRVTEATRPAVLTPSICRDDDPDAVIVTDGDRSVSCAIGIRSITDPVKAAAPLAAMPRWKLVAPAGEEFGNSPKASFSR